MSVADPKNEAEFVRNKIDTAKISNFGVPHFIVDGLFSNEMVQAINHYWPDTSLFHPEIAGNHIFRIKKSEYGRMRHEEREFWRSFNEVIWPNMLAATAMAFAGPALDVFGELYDQYLSLDGEWPLTLMQGDINYAGHVEHTHFWNAPHWAFTVLIYIDPEERVSKGTSIQRILPMGNSIQNQSSYLADNLDWRTEIAMKNISWTLPKSETFVANYRLNRMFVFLDGPLAIHGVPYDNLAHTPNPDRSKNDGKNSRRRILRSHVKVHHAPFYDHHSRFLPEPLDPTRLTKVMDQYQDLSNLTEADWIYRHRVARAFYKNRLKSYADAAQSLHEQSQKGLLDRLFGGRKKPEDKYYAQFMDTIP